ncbi:MAG: hypothetical protein EOO27_14055 [Comamonadaceae bacterium]|nr:MAG: hypothetical protein EOO27_14055 [Comamonadaceae bacterium]
MRRHFEGPYEVEEDISYAEMTARRRPEHKTLLIDNDHISDSITTALELRHHGTPDTTIAHRLNLTPEALEKRLRTAGHGAPLSFADRHFLHVLEKVIPTGKPFSTEALPIPDNTRVAAVALTNAVKQGRLRKAGMYQTGKGKIGLWQGIVDAEAA